MADDDELRNINFLASLNGFMEKLQQFSGNISANFSTVLDAVNSLSYGGRGGGRGGGGYSTSTPFPNDEGFGLSAGGVGGTTRDYVSDYQDIDPKTNKNRFVPGTISGIIGTAGGLSIGLQQIMGMIAPSPQKAMYTEMFGSRMGFYNRNISLENAYNMQLNAASLGLATSDMDAMYASNVAASSGLLPGLKNFGATQQFGGVMGGASLFSNLSPGIGLQGGMGAVAALNQARSVNRLRMIGINVRNEEGTGMRDIPAIIDDLYDILKNAAGEEPTEQAIAVSAMSGNALDSLLNQYFGNDENLRQSVLAALIQKARNKGAKMAGIGTKAELAKTGGLTQTVISTANRNAVGTRLAQNFATPVNVGTIQANTVVSGISDLLSNLADRDMIKGVTALQSFLEVLAGAGNGAGAGLISLLASTTTSLTDLFQINKYGRTFSTGASDILGGVVGIGSALMAPGIGANIPNPINPATAGFLNTKPINVNISWDWVKKGAGRG